MHSQRSITAAYLRGDRSVPVPPARRPGSGKWLTVRGARENNLRDLDVAFPLGRFVAVTGVSGSGKSSLVTQILYPALAARIWNARERPGAHDRIEGIDQVDKVIEIDQSPIGRTPRSNPATYTGLWAPLRELLAAVPESRLRGYMPGRFSFNVKGGRCEACEGAGIVQIEMHFLPDVYVQCEVCKGKRYNRETLEIHYKGRNVAEILEMTVDEALAFFSAVPSIRNKLQTLHDVGMGYVHLGQPATTLSGGEAQRVKLATELSKRATGQTLYILDEPTTGLHFDDVARLLEVLGRLVEAGNTVVVIEHNLDVIKSADWVIDLGPEGGAAGGDLVAQKFPADRAQARRNAGPVSWTAIAGNSSRNRALRTKLAQIIASAMTLPKVPMFDFAPGTRARMASTARRTDMPASIISPKKAKNARNRRHSSAPKAKWTKLGAVRVPDASCTTPTSITA